MTVKVVRDGPLQVRGPITLLDHDGTAYDLGARRTVTLCRCGRSGIKPFCDGSHARTGFRAAQRAPRPDSADGESTAATDGGPR